MRRIITISREFGSGGREIGRRLAGLLNLAYYDQEIVAKLCERGEFSEEYIRYVSEKRPLPLLPITIARTFGMKTHDAAVQNLNFYMEESRLLTELAKESDCVIVGRCGDFVLREMEPFRMFLYGDMELKLKRCREKGEDAGSLSDGELRKKIMAVDRRRARYYQFFTSQIWADKANYDLCVNTGGWEMKELAGRLEDFLG